MCTSSLYLLAKTLRNVKQTIPSNHLINNAPVVCTDWQKHLGMYLDKALNFNLHIKEKMSKAMKGICVIQKLNKTLRHSLITIYKSFMRPHLDYGDKTYDQPNNESFTLKIERIQCKAALANL